MRTLPVIAVFAVIATAARADTVTSQQFAYDGTVNGLRNGRLSMTLRAGGEKVFELEQVTAIELDNVPRFGEAEKARGDAKASAAIYKQVISTLNRAEVRLLAQARAIEPTEKDGRWLEALGLFIEVYQASPVEAVWKMRPMRLPNQGNKMLAEGAEELSKAIAAAKGEEARKNLKTFLVEVHLKAGNSDAAARLAREITTGISEAAPAARPLVPVVTAADELFGKKDYAGAAKTAGDELAKNPSPEAAVRLFTIQAESLEALKKPDDAAMAWLRIAAHYPTSAAAPGALLRAAAIQKTLNRPEAVASLEKEILTQYPESREAAGLKRE